jgi:glutaredoxin
MIKVYSNNCIKCLKIKHILDSKKIDYKYITKESEVDKMIEKYQVKSFPFGITDEGKVLSFIELLQYSIRGV